MGELAPEGDDDGVGAGGARLPDVVGVPVVERVVLGNNSGDFHIFPPFLSETFFTCKIYIVICYIDTTGLYPFKHNIIIMVKLWRRIRL